MSTPRWRELADEHAARWPERPPVGTVDFKRLQHSNRTILACLDAAEKARAELLAELERLAAAADMGRL
jgi:hypothetical protein